MKKSYPEDFTESSSISSSEPRAVSLMQSLQGVLRCLECPQTFKDNASLRQHFMESHKGLQMNGSMKSTSNSSSANNSTNTTFSCTHCSEIFPCPVTLRVHQTEHVLPNVQQIMNLHPNCNPSFNKNGSNNRLLNITFVCHICNSSFPSRELLVDHANVHLLGHNCENPSCQETYSKNDDINRISSICNSKSNGIGESINLLVGKNFNSNKKSTQEHFTFKVERVLTSNVHCTANNTKSPSTEKVRLSPKINNFESTQQIYQKQQHHHQQQQQQQQQNKQQVKKSKANQQKLANLSSPSSTSPSSNSMVEPRIVNCNGKKRFQCKVCHKYLSSKLSHEEHSRVHTGEKPYRCVICVKSYAVKNTYRQHMASHKLSGSMTTSSGGGGGCGSGEKSHTIPTCNSATTTTTTNNAISNTPSTTTSPLYKCSVCQDIFSSQDKLDYHPCLRKVGRKRGNAGGGGGVIEDGNGGEGFRCKICGKTFAKKEWRKKHYLSHAGESCFRCDICGSIFVDEQIYLIHAQDHFCPSEIKKSFTDCNICGKVFPGRDLYERHSCRFAGVNSSG
jgi:hypothetical protein